MADDQLPPLAPPGKDELKTLMDELLSKDKFKPLPVVKPQTPTLRPDAQKPAAEAGTPDQLDTKPEQAPPFLFPTKPEDQIKMVQEQKALLAELMTAQNITAAAKVIKSEIAGSGFKVTDENGEVTGSKNFLYYERQYSAALEKAIVKPAAVGPQGDIAKMEPAALEEAAEKMHVAIHKIIPALEKDGISVRNLQGQVDIKVVEGTEPVAYNGVVRSYKEEALRLSDQIKPDNDVERAKLEATREELREQIKARTPLKPELKVDAPPNGSGLDVQKIGNKRPVGTHPGNQGAIDSPLFTREGKFSIPPEGAMERLRQMGQKAKLKPVPPLQPRMDPDPANKGSNPAPLFNPNPPASEPEPQPKKRSGPIAEETKPKKMSAVEVPTGEFVANNLSGDAKGQPMAKSPSGSSRFS